VKPLRSFIPPLAAMLLASGSMSAAAALIDTSEIRFISRESGAKVEGRFRRWRANVDFRPDDLARSRADLEIELASIDLAHKGSAALFARPRWFDTARFPVATFASNAIRRVGNDRYEFAGTLSLKGVSREVVVPVAVTRDAAGNQVALGKLTFNRLDFSLGQPQRSADSTAADRVAVRVRVVLPAVAA
jgi:polyisoprenoid-binding protein YceI